MSEQHPQRTTAETPPDQRSALPELEFTIVGRSEKPVAEGEKLTVDAVATWNGHSIVLVDKLGIVRVYDDRLRSVEDFNSPKSNKSAIVNWKQVGEVHKTNSIKHHGPGFGFEYTKLPSVIRTFAGRELAIAKEKRGETYFELGKLGVYQYTDFKTCSVSDDEQYIVFAHDGGGYIAFITQNEAGVTLAPRNWIRVDPDYTGAMPLEGLESFAQKAEWKESHIITLGDEQIAQVEDNRITILRKLPDKKDVVYDKVFVDETPSIGNNVVIDPSNPECLYYCQSKKPKAMMKLAISGDPKTWSPVVAEFPKQYSEVRNLQADPSGTVLFFYCGQDLVFVTKDTLEEVKRLPNIANAVFDRNGTLRAIDEDFHLVKAEVNIGELAKALDRRRVANLASGIKLVDVFQSDVATGRTGAASEKGLDYLEPLKKDYEGQFSPVLDSVTTLEGVSQLSKGVQKLRAALAGQGLKPAEVGFIVHGIEEGIAAKQREFAAKNAHSALAQVRSIMGGGLSMATVSEAREQLNTIKPIEALLDAPLREQVTTITQELERYAAELFRTRGTEIVADVEGLVVRTKNDLQEFTTKSQMDDWLEYRYPQLKSRLGVLARDCPMEAQEAYTAIIAARDQLQAVAAEFEDRFKRQYAAVREKAAQRIETAVEMLEQDVAGLIERLKAKEFTDRQGAQQYLDSSESKKTLEAEISALAAQSPDAAKGLERMLKVQISNALSEIERGSALQVAKTGAQMVLIGTTLFPKWEAHVEDRPQRSVDIVFREDAATHGPGVKPSEIFGDVALSIRSANAPAQTVPLYDGWHAENEWRLGLAEYLQHPIAPSYVTAADFKKIKKEYTDWSGGQTSKLRLEWQQKREALKALYAEREKIGSRTEADDQWKERYRAALDDYAKFCSQHALPILRRIERLAHAPETAHTNGKGYIPAWQSHWVMDPQTEKNLDQMASAFKMQLDLQEGLLNLKGHAGTGKDVLVKMFCNLTHRPYFGTDCSKWTTEFELSEDVILESKDGASQTIKVPSALLTGVTTPGALVYLNEFNAMSEQAQIFLHALMDEKRSMTLKTSSGKVVRAHPSVLLAGSMNPGYPGTFTPQFATRSRMVSIEVDYPPLERDRDSGDLNTNPPYDASEALRIAREVESLSDLTYEANREHNEFVKLWDQYINGIDNGAADPTTIQKFDLDTILALVQFSNKLRKNFVTIFERSREASKALPVTQPITGRELRRCAYVLSKMPPEQKIAANPEAIARELLERFFLTHIDAQEDREKIRTTMATWPSKKRIGV